MANIKCSYCGQEAKGTSILFGLNELGGEPFQVTEEGAKMVKFSQAFSLCETCAQRQGKAPKKVWNMVFFGNIVMFACMLFSIFYRRMSAQNIPVTGNMAIMGMTFAWFFAMISGIILIVQAKLKGTAVLLILLQFSHSPACPLCLSCAERLMRTW